MDTAKLEVQLESIFVKQFPALPKNIKDIIVKISPYLAILGIVVSLPAILTILGLGTVIAPFVVLEGVGPLTGLSLSIIFVVINTIIMIMAIPGLFTRQKKAWRLMFYSTLISALSSLISINLVSLIIGTAISFYFLFQVKSYYK